MRLVDCPNGTGNARDVFKINLLGKRDRSVIERVRWDCSARIRGETRPKGNSEGKRGADDVNEGLTTSHDALCLEDLPS